MKNGENSGNEQEVKEILVDCDAVLYLVKTKGPACHLREENASTIN